MSPTSNSHVTSPGKRPGLARRSVSSHAIVSTRTSPATNATDATDPQKATAVAGHKARAHVVGGGHRAHGRNPSFGKNLNKLQRMHPTQNMHLFNEGTTTIGTGARHQRKKSAPVTPVESPRTSGSHVRWEGGNTSLGEHKSHGSSMRKNYSTPALHRNTSAIIPRKALVTDRPQSAKSRPKKSVGFELVGDSDSEEEWEDSTQSPESTRRGSAVQSTKDSAESSQVLVDPLTFVKRSYPQIPQSRSLPESTISNLPQAIEDSDDETANHERASSVSSREQERDSEQESQTHEPEDIANRLLNQSRVSKARPAMSSISAVGTATGIDTARRNESITSLNNLASNHGGPRHAPSVPSSQAQSSLPQSSSIEGGVSRFIVNPQAGAHATSRTDSDPNTPSSFLPHYHPQAPLTPERSTAKKAKATSPQPRPLGDGIPSRTQQKLWLQRTATLTTSPPDSNGSSALPQSTIDPVFIAASHTRNGQYDNGRGAVNGSARVGASHDSEVKHTRKAFEKTSLELDVVRRFQSPTKNSFTRLQQLANTSDRPNTASESTSNFLAKSSKSAPSLTTGQFSNALPNRRAKAAAASSGDNESSTESADNTRHRASKPGRVYFQDHDDVINISDTSSDPAERLAVESQQGGSSSANGPTGMDSKAVSGTDREGYFATEQEMLLRRMWESRGEVASPG
ncbi:hypothetical protein EYB26_001489 [Talaromyces marneffei]|uniref:uncharacterized protein n=1 Tax=Talaromyces marneffei TaxID=37727 RepID=UPI0012A87FFB|nr:uncharacterized protein EYB26_001489 [Talaromyces marneffei]QGA13838.1 hypothetical protein EYB26_001489 [Talaromyces marneffei]